VGIRQAFLEQKKLFGVQADINLARIVLKAE
jgi:hypothetical protein